MLCNACFASILLGHPTLAALFFFFLLALKPGMRKQWNLVPLPLPRLRFRFHKNIVISLVAIPPTIAEAADLADLIRFRFRIPVCKLMGVNEILCLVLW